MTDDKLAVKTLRNNAAVKLRNRSLSLGQKVRLDHGSRRRRLLSHGRAVQIVRLKRAVSLPTATSTVVVSPTLMTTDSFTQSLQTSDKSPADEPKKDRVGVFERSWVDTLTDTAVVTAATLVECSKFTSVVEDDVAVTGSVALSTQESVISTPTKDAVCTADVEAGSNEMDLSSAVNDVSYPFRIHFICTMFHCNVRRPPATQPCLVMPCLHVK